MEAKRPYHVPVLCEESLNVLDIRAGGTYVDATLGGGGHFREIVNRVGSSGCVVGIDRDSESIKKNASFPVPPNVRVVFAHGPFSSLAKILVENNLFFVDGILADLGVSSRQIDDPARGFTYMQDAPLDMRMNSNQKETALTIIARARVDELAHILSEFGEVGNAPRMAQTIVSAHNKSPLVTSADLKQCLFAEYGPHLPVKVFSKVFQALRIAVNGELDELKSLLCAAETHLTVGGRIAIIAYHSLEDRIVKQFFAQEENPCTCPIEVPICSCGKVPRFSRITRKAIKPQQSEIAQNPRSRSARLRCAQKIAPPSGGIHE